MKLLNLNFSTLILRFYLIMAVVIISFFIGFPVLSLLALPLFAISLLGITFERKKRVAGGKQAASAPGAKVAMHEVSH